MNNFFFFALNRVGRFSYPNSLQLQQCVCCFVEYHRVPFEDLRLLWIDLILLSKNKNARYNGLLHCSRIFLESMKNWLQGVELSANALDRIAFQTFITSSAATVYH